MSRRISRHRIMTIGLTVAALTTLSAAPVAAADHGAPPSGPTVIAQGLNNPRQLAFGAGGDLYVAEAGSGGASPCMPGPEGGTICFGTTGSITKVSLDGSATRVVTGLPSLAHEGDGSQALGTSDVAPWRDGTIAVLIGLGANPAIRSTLPPAGADMGTLQLVDTGSGQMSTFADVSAYEAQANPVGVVDSNPVGLAMGMGRFAVADAGGNDVVSVSRDGQVSTVATFPDRMVDAPDFLGLPAGSQIPMQAVPTSAVQGPDGAWYVSQLTGFPFPVGAANIYRVGRDGQVSVYASGLTNVTDLAFRGTTLYAVEIASAGLLAGPTGALVRVDEGSTAPMVVLGDLFAPYGLTVRGTTAYVTTGSISAGGGQVLSVPLG